jgi:hypothetical protein
MITTFTLVLFNILEAALSDSPVDSHPAGYKILSNLIKSYQKHQKHTQAYYPFFKLLTGLSSAAFAV